MAQSRIKINEIFTKRLEKSCLLWYTHNRKLNIYPWHSWIARQTPTLKAVGSNPIG